METSKLKNTLLEMMSNIHDEQLLHALYDFLKNHKQGKTSSMWDNLTDLEKEQVFVALEESENEEELIPYKEVFK